MALKYKLVQKRNLGEDQEENPEKVYVYFASDRISKLVR